MTGVNLRADSVGIGGTTEFLDARSVRDPAPEASFRFTTRAAADAELRVVRATIREALNALYESSIELCSADVTFDFDTLLGARAVLEIHRGPRVRRLCGVIRRVARLDTWAGQRRARVEVAPALWSLSQRVDSRIFQGLSAVEVVRAVIADAAIDGGVDLRLTQSYPAREYCVQYRESDLDFVSRLLEEEGIGFYFLHEGDTETLVLSDGPSHPLCPTLDRRPVPFAPPQAQLASVEVVQRLDLSRELRPTGHTTRDYDFTRPLAELDMTWSHPRPNTGARAVYEYPGRFTLGGYDDATRTYAEHDGARRAELRDLEQTHESARAEGSGNVTGFLPGRVFELVGHEHGDLDRRYLLLAASHELHAPEELVAAGVEREPSRGLDRYRNAFVCAPAATPWIPPRRAPRPMILAAQTATVVGSPGEEIHVDSHGRIRVQFHWDRQGRRDARSSCWIRVAQTWAGAGWGALFTPRIGMEVLVTFLEGDPDRPLVTGCVYNGQNPPPVELPLAKTRSVIRTSSSPGGLGFNELSFEDAAGSEEVFLRAQRDYNEVILNNQTSRVGANRSEEIGRTLGQRVGEDAGYHVGRDRRARVAHDDALEVDGRADTRVKGDHATEVGGAMTATVHGRHALEVRGSHALTVGTDEARASSDAHVYGTASHSATERIVLDAQEGLTIRCGESTIELTPTAIVLRAPTVEIAPTNTLECSTKDGPSLTMGRDVEVLAKRFKLFTESGALEVDKEFKARGTSIRLGYDPNAPTREKTEAEPETKPFSGRFLDYFLRPYAKKTYHLMVEGERLEGVTDADGKIEREIPKRARQVTVRIWLDQFPEGRQRLYSIQLGKLPPSTSLIGLKLRLKNLGYYLGPVDEDEGDDFRTALTSFQDDHRESDSLSVTGDPDDATRRAIERVHGS